MPDPNVPRPAAPRVWVILWKQLSVSDRKLLICAAFAMILASALTAVLPLLIGDLVNNALSRRSATVGALAGSLAEIGALVVIAQLLEVVRRQLVENVATGFERDSRQRAYEHLMRLDLGYLRSGLVGGIYGRTNRSIEGAVKLVKLGAMDLLPAMTLAISAIVVALTTQLLVGVVMAMVVPTGLLLVRAQVRSQAGVRVELRNHKDAIDGKVVELLPAMEVVRATGASQHFGSSIRRACAQLRATEILHHRAMSLFDAAKAVNEGLWLLLTLAAAIEVSGPGHLTAGRLTTYVLLYAGVTTPLRALHRIVDEASESAQQATDLIGLLGEPEDASFQPAPLSSPLSPTVACSSPALELSNVSFTYDGSSVRTLDRLTLLVQTGERVGLVGATACGKSTLLKIVARLLHGHDGTVRIDGRETVEIPHEELVNLVGWVSQEPKIFAGTVRENIVLGNPEATAEDVARAAQRANVHEDIMRTPDGYETLVGERGDTLSGGQRQRICLARAILNTPPILLLDEPTSALDGPSQAAVQTAIDDLENVTLLVVAHRLDTLRTMDRIVVLEGGRIIEEGTFTDLARRSGRFAEMLRSNEQDAA